MRALKILLAIAALAVVSSCGQKVKQLSEKPELVVTNVAPIAPKESIVALNVVLPYSVMSAALDKALPPSFVSSGRQKVCVQVYDEIQKTIEKTIGGDVGRFVASVARIVTEVVTVRQAREVCQDVDHEATITRDAPASVAPIPNGLRLSVPLSISGGAGFPGDIAKVLSLTKKNFRGALTAFVDVSLDVGENWCPVVTATPDFVWRDKAQLEVAGKFWIDIDGNAGPKIKSAMEEAAKQLPNQLSCDQIKNLVRPLWKQHALVVAAKEGMPPIQVVLEPTRVGFSGLSYGENGVKLALMLGTKSIVTVQQTKKNAMPSNPASLAGLGELPKLERIPADKNEFSIAVPISATYKAFNDAATQAIGGETFETDTPAGKASVTIKAVEIYPSGQQIVLGVDFVANVEKAKILNTKGKIYLLGRPELDAKNQILRFKQIEFSRILDNDLWNAISLVFSDVIVKEIESKAVLPFSGQINELRNAMQVALAEAAKADGLNVTLRDDFLGIEQVMLGVDSIDAQVGFKGMANIFVVDATKIKR